MTLEERMNRARARQEMDTKAQNATKYALKTPENVKFYKIKEGINLIDIVPYRISNPDNILVKTPRLGYKLGDEDYKFSYSSHRNIGQGNNYVCMSKTFGKKCAICDIQRGLWNIKSKDEVKTLFPQDRTLYNIIDLNDLASGVQLFDASDYYFENEISNLAKQLNKFGKNILYGDRLAGCSIQFMGTKEKFKTSTYMKPKNFQFVPREKQYDESILDQTFPIDSFAVIPNYDDVKNDYYQIDEPQESLETFDDSMQDSADNNPFLESATAKMEPLKPATFTTATTPCSPVIGQVQVSPQPTKTTMAPEQTPNEGRPTKTRVRNAIAPNNPCPYGKELGKDFDKFEECHSCSDEDFEKCANLHDTMFK